MKKSFLLLPISVAVLAACSSNTPAPVESADGSLSPGMMQPVDASSGGTWEPQIQQQNTMPAGMDQSVYSPSTSQPSLPVSHQPTPPTSSSFDIPRKPVTGEPDYSKIARGSYQGESYMVRKGDSMYLISYISGLSIKEIAALNNLSEPYTLATGQVLKLSNKVSTTSTMSPSTAVGEVGTNVKPTTQHFEIPRNPADNRPDYSKIDKGFYKGETYTVRKGDTMYLIAYISGLDVKELASLNNMSEPYRLSVGQTLRVSNGRVASTSSQPVTQPVTVPVSQPKSNEVTYTPGPHGTQYGSDGTIIGPIKSGVSSAPVPVQPEPVVKPVESTSVPVPSTRSKHMVSNVTWQWPTKGNIVQGFSTADGGNKGIDIAGSRGQAVNAAAAGRVVYAGNALRGYGNLIIIKHNDDYLSAYAHNESILVKDQQEVRAGQQIAKMGSSGTNSVKLHFEIRYKGKSVDPTRYLPKR
ncbi:murein hydrolase activator NlpD [Pasteurella multocida]|uniref:murein hydrolase activator NlpD n=1 Tax=Pasteurella multocida TaxID=747 RepID=UPI00240D3B3F|nr:murein hydrolase activator NlpD [Pasteurella multocida]MDG2542126.1 murein hydrolase activator NlpD [Pasteurella multocida]